MQETLAAAMITFTGWDAQTPLFDPMCGSGTLLCEALIKGARIPPALLRSRFGLEHMPDFDSSLWAEVRGMSQSLGRNLPQGLIRGSDVDQHAVRAARTNCSQLPGGKGIVLQETGFVDAPGLNEGVIVCNPPYGRRLQDKRQTAELLESFGRFLRRRCSGATAYVYLGSRELHRQIPLSPAWTKDLSNGGLQGCLAKYRIR
jgi:putative N6-adenine-specific DNA methylase